MSTVTGQDNVVRMLAAIREGARPKMLETMRKVAIDMQRYVQVEKLSGQVLNRRTGTLRNSIFERVTEGADSVSAVTGTGLSYAKPLEDGAAPHVILPVRAKMLSFVVGGRRVFARQVNHPGNRAYRFLKGSLEERAPVEIARIRKSMAELIEASRA
ncbi:MAG: hypothetical protein KGO96_13500 [Elusimicrobia bacterium]|nr:hypothetical protein [Elusimicrobiota bacterium]